MNSKTGKLLLCFLLLIGAGLLIAVLAQPKSTSTSGQRLVTKPPQTSEAENNLPSPPSPLKETFFSPEENKRCGIIGIVLVTGFAALQSKKVCGALCEITGHGPTTKKALEMLENKLPSVYHKKPDRKINENEIKEGTREQILRLFSSLKGHAADWSFTSLTARGDAIWEAIYHIELWVSIIYGAIGVLRWARPAYLAYLERAGDVISASMLIWPFLKWPCSWLITPPNKDDTYQPEADTLNRFKIRQDFWNGLVMLFCHILGKITTETGSIWNYDGRGEVMEREVVIEEIGPHTKWTVRRNMVYWPISWGLYLAGLALQKQIRNKVFGHPSLRKTGEYKIIIGLKLSLQVLLILAFYAMRRLCYAQKKKQRYEASVKRFLRQPGHPKRLYERGGYTAACGCLILLVDAHQPRGIIKWIDIGLSAVYIKLKNILPIESTGQRISLYITIELLALALFGWCFEAFGVWASERQHGKGAAGHLERLRSSGAYWATMIFLQNAPRSTDITQNRRSMDFSWPLLLIPMIWQAVLSF